MENLVAYVNSTMQEVNANTDELYEALMDQSKDEVIDIVKKLQATLRDVVRSMNE